MATKYQEQPEEIHLTNNDVKKYPFYAKIWQVFLLNSKTLCLVVSFLIIVNPFSGGSKDIKESYKMGADVRTIVVSNCAAIWTG